MWPVKIAGSCPKHPAVYARPVGRAALLARGAPSNAWRAGGRAFARPRDMRLSSANRVAVVGFKHRAVKLRMHFQQRRHILRSLDV